MPIANPPSKEVAARMSRRLANYKLTDAVLTKIADRVLIDGLVIHGFNPCIYGICIDYFSDKPPQIEAMRGRGISKFEVFPYGIIDWDRFLVKVGFEVPELEGKLVSHGARF